MSSLGIDYGRLEEAERRLSRAGEIVRGIKDLALELDALVDDPDDPVAYALETAASMNGNGKAPAELEPARPPATAPPMSDPEADAHERLHRAPAPHRERHARADVEAALVDYFEAHPREWVGKAELMGAVPGARATVDRAINDLLSTGTIETNGFKTAGRKYRLDPGLADELERQDDEPDEPAAEVPSPIDPGAEGGDDEQDDEGEPIDVKRELERVAGLAPPRRSAPAAPPRAAGPFPGRILPGAGTTLQGPQGQARADLKDRIRRHLLDEASTISELALALDVPRRDIAPIVIELEADEAEPVVKVAGAIRGRGETIYSNIA